MILSRHIPESKVSITTKFLSNSCALKKIPAIANCYCNLIFIERPASKLFMIPLDNCTIYIHPIFITEASVTGSSSSQSIHILTKSKICSRSTPIFTRDTLTSFDVLSLPHSTSKKSTEKQIVCRENGITRQHSRHLLTVLEKIPVAT